MDWDERLEIARSSYLEEENKVLKVQLTIERQLFSLLEKAVDQSTQSNEIFNRFHRYREKENL